MLKKLWAMSCPASKEFTIDFNMTKQRPLHWQGWRTLIDGILHHRDNVLPMKKKGKR